MQKLKNTKSKEFHLLDYQPFLKNNNLKENKFRLKKKVFENFIFLEDKDSICIELNNRQSFFIPKLFLPSFHLKNKKSIFYFIQTKYKNNFLLNYDLNYNILYYFTKLIFQNNLDKNKIKGRIVNNNQKYVFLSFFGFILKMNSKNLHQDKRLFYGRRKKVKKKLSSYKLKYLNFHIISDFFQTSTLSRKTYVQEIIEKKKISRKKKKKKYATI